MLDGVEEIDYAPVHPHGRGDNPEVKWLSCPHVGSPPRAWGQCGAGVHADDAARFTPTGVGTIEREGLILPWRSVHPHGRGDNERRFIHNYHHIGSPPRAWGQ